MKSRFPLLKEIGENRKFKITTTIIIVEDQGRNWEELKKAMIAGEKFGEI